MNDLVYGVEGIIKFLLFAVALSFQDQRSQILNHVLLIIVSKLLHESGIVFLLHAFRVNEGLNGVFIAVIGHEGLGQSRVHIDL